MNFEDRKLDDNEVLIKNKPVHMYILLLCLCKPPLYNLLKNLHCCSGLSRLGQLSYTEHLHASHSKACMECVRINDCYVTGHNITGCHLSHIWSVLMLVLPTLKGCCTLASICECVRSLCHSWSRDVKARALLSKETLLSFFLFPSIPQSVVCHISLVTDSGETVNLACCEHEHEQSKNSTSEFQASSCHAFTER